MTRKEAIRNHRKMWNWLAENPGKWKRDYLMRYDPEAKLVANCYLCEYTWLLCNECPLEWKTDRCFRGLFGEWEYAMKCGDYALAAEIAKQIAELPEKEEI